MKNWGRAIEFLITWTIVSYIGLLAGYVVAFLLAIMGRGGTFPIFGPTLDSIVGLGLAVAQLLELRRRLPVPGSWLLGSLLKWGILHAAATIGIPPFLLVIGLIGSAAEVYALGVVLPRGWLRPAVLLQMTHYGLFFWALGLDLSWLSVTAAFAASGWATCCCWIRWGRG